MMYQNRILIIFNFLTQFLKCECCKKIRLHSWTYVERPWDGLHDQWLLCRKCRQKDILTIQHILYSGFFNKGN